MRATKTVETQCCVVGGGPAGVMLSLLLARAGISVIILEKHADFLRDFRGDTVHPSTLCALDDLGLLAKFKQLPQQKIQQLNLSIGSNQQSVVDFAGLEPFDYMSLVPQWDLLNLLVSEARQEPNFEICMQSEVTQLLHANGAVAGVRAVTPDGPLEVRAELTVACDGRHSTVRQQAGLRATELGAPMDVLWFRLPRDQSGNNEPFGLVGAGSLMVLLNRTDYWQIAFVVPKGSDTKMRAKPIAHLRQSVVQLAPFLASAASTLESWDSVKTLEVQVDRLEHWFQGGLLLIGDAAHAMSPIGGVGINLAIQDAIAAANRLVPIMLQNKPVDDTVLRSIQLQRLPAAKRMQFVQLQIQNRFILRALSNTGKLPTLPKVLQWLLRFRAIRNIPARVVGYGFRFERIVTANFRPSGKPM